MEFETAREFRVIALAQSPRDHPRKPNHVSAGQYSPQKKTAPEMNQARFRESLEAEARIELANTGFANPRLTTWLLRPRKTW